MFDFAVNLSNFIFRNAGYGILDNDQRFPLGLSDGALAERTFEDIGASVINGITSITFAYIDGGNNQNKFYFSSNEAEGETGGQIPPPVVMPLLLVDLGVLSAAKASEKPDPVSNKQRTEKGGLSRGRPFSFAYVVLSQ